MEISGKYSPLTNQWVLEEDPLCEINAFKTSLMYGCNSMPSRLIDAPKVETNNGEHVLSFRQPFKTRMTMIAH